MRREEKLVYRNLFFTKQIIKVGINSVHINYGPGTSYITQEIIKDLQLALQMHNGKTVITLKSEILVITSSALTLFGDIKGYIRCE